jgi:hypothetical protein
LLQSLQAINNSLLYLVSNSSLLYLCSLVQEDTNLLPWLGFREVSSFGGMNSKEVKDIIIMVVVVGGHIKQLPERWLSLSSGKGEGQVLIFSVLLNAKDVGFRESHPSCKLQFSE